MLPSESAHPLTTACPASSDVPTKQIELPRSAQAAGQARRFLEERFGDRLSDEALANAGIVVSELVNNAVVHGAGRIALSTSVSGDTLRVEVIDEGTGEARVVRERGAADAGGLGLRIVETLSEEWGAYEGSTHVWADLPVG